MRFLIVDDEPLARVRIREFLRAEPDVQSVKECGSGGEAIELMRHGDVDLVLLDVQMPDIDGFTVLERLSGGPMPLVVFVTAYERYALRAFEVCALDYLLKPVGPERFAAALARARLELARNGGADLHRAIQSLIALMKDRTTERVEVLAVKSGQRIVPVRIDEIDWVEAEGSYVRLHVGHGSHLLRESIGALEGVLPRRFRRIHRSTIVNVDRISEMQPYFRKDYKVVLRDGTRLTLSRNYLDRVPEFLGRG